MSWQQPYESRFLSVNPEKRRFMVNRRVFNDAAVFEEEKEKILKKSWQYICHRSEFKRKNDFIVRKMLDSEILVTLDKHGKINAFFNTCTHRGALLGKSPCGNRAVFSCPYHGWGFSPSGEIITRGAQYGYTEDMDADGAYNLKHVPRFEERGGFFFINFDADAVSLDEFLGAAGDRIDMLTEHSRDGIEVISGVHEYEIKANYKMLCENSYDGYHLLPTHNTYLPYQRSMLQGLPQQMPEGRAVCLGNGHATFEIDFHAGRPIAQWLPVWGEDARVIIERRGAELLERLGPERGNLVANIQRNMVIFPNTVMNDQQSIQIRSILPVAHDRMIARAWVFGLVNEEPELRRVRLEGALSFLGPGGFATPDDIDNLESCQTGYTGGGVEWNDLSKGFEPDEDANGGTDIQDNELHLRSYWMQYDRMMSGSEGEA